MKKKLLAILICGVIVLGITGCGNEENKLGGDKPYETNFENVIFNISARNKSCIPVSLTVYKDNKYELFTTYKGCRPGDTCTMMLSYTKSIKGTYDYDVMKIIENSTNADELTFTNDNLPEYDIYMGSTYVESGYAYNYVVEQGKTNKYLDEFLKELDIDLNVCAEPEYK